MSTTRRITLDVSDRGVFVLLGLDDTFLDERVPLMTLRTLPQQLGAPIVASYAHMGVEVENGFASQIHVPLNAVFCKVQRGQGLPHDLMDGQGVRIVR